MGADVIIKQKGLIKKRLKIEDLDELANAHDFAYGVSNEMFVFEEYEYADVDDVNFVIFSQNYGRGFEFFVERKHNIGLRLNIPSTRSDVHEFYDFLRSCCELLKTETFEQDGEEYDVSEIPDLIEKMVDTSGWALATLLEDMDNIQIFGAVYPIILEDEIIKQLLNDKNRLDLFEEYLKEKQTKDYYYAIPMYYEKNGLLYGVIGLPENCPTILPIEAAIPFWHDLPEGSTISHWSIDIGCEVNGEYETAASLSYDKFLEVVDVGKLEKFDYSNFIIEIDEKLMNKLKEFSE